jgi:hypothetical protein
VRGRGRASLQDVPTLCFPTPSAFLSADPGRSSGGCERAGERNVSRYLSLQNAPSPSFPTPSSVVYICIKTMSVKGVYVIMKLMKQKK